MLERYAQASSAADRSAADTLKASFAGVPEGREARDRAGTAPSKRTGRKAGRAVDEEGR